MRHTAGPWELVKIKGGHQCVSKGRGVIVLQHDSSEEAQANARLIAMAPELLEAAERALPWLGKMIADGGHLGAVAPSACVKAMEALQAAIAKAEGNER